ncbi:hypothetical protein GE09DRAFT_546699 [Coniochaeta sp. 2T2.1]|nr:hypothetical protein GE09DRAFT_546699 [Coniochaeta sp. 2T2.1]
MSRHQNTHIASHQPPSEDGTKEDVTTKRTSPHVGPMLLALRGKHHLLDLVVGERSAASALAAESEVLQKRLGRSAVADGELGALRDILQHRECDLPVPSLVDLVANVPDWQTGVVEARCDRVDGHSIRHLESVRQFVSISLIYDRQRLEEPHRTTHQGSVQRRHLQTTATPTISTLLHQSHLCRPTRAVLRLERSARHAGVAGHHAGQCWYYPPRHRTESATSPSLHLTRVTRPLPSIQAS